MLPTKSAAITCIKATAIVGIFAIYGCSSQAPISDPFTGCYTENPTSPPKFKINKQEDGYVFFRLEDGKWVSKNKSKKLTLQTEVIKSKLAIAGNEAKAMHDAISHAIYADGEVAILKFNRESIGSNSEIKTEYMIIAGLTASISKAECENK